MKRTTKKFAFQKNMESASGADYGCGKKNPDEELLFVISPDDCIVDANNNFVTRLGAREDQVVGSDFKNYLWEGTSIFRNLLHDVHEVGFASGRYLTLYNRYGEIVQICCDATSFRNQSGSLAGIFVDARERTTESKLYEQRKNMKIAL